MTNVFFLCYNCFSYGVVFMHEYFIFLKNHFRFSLIAFIVALVFFVISIFVVNSNNKESGIIEIHESSIKIMIN